MKFDMVFEGGGAKGMAFVGAMRALEDKGHTSGRLIGTSAGAITATLIAAGYSAGMMENALGEIDEKGRPVFENFMDRPKAKDYTAEDIENSVTMKCFKSIDIPLVPERVEKKLDELILKGLLKLRAYPVLFSFVERGGLYLGNAFLDWMRRKLDEVKEGYAAMTMQEFFEATGRDLSLVASDTVSQDMLVLNHRTAPNCPVSWAVRMSMSIPFAWHEVIWQPGWDPYRTFDPSGRTVHKEVSLAGHAIVDGGALSNFPIDKLTSDEPSVRAVMGDAAPDRKAVLGLLIDETLKVEGAPPPPLEDDDDDAGVAGDIKKLRTVRRVSRLLNTMMQAHDKQLIAANNDLICRLPAKEYGTMEFDMTEARKKALVDAAQNAMIKHLAGRA
ncbi:MAG: patatin-like phospholipase family protein [Desulfobacterales bacterium]|nr:MAG: patatin-like phospholipase family protein [Desulfobacterales bacterium]